MADEAPRNATQRLAGWLTEAVEWVEATFGDEAISRQVRADLGLNPQGNPHVEPLDPQVKTKIDEFVEKEDVDEEALIVVLGQLVELMFVVRNFVTNVQGGAGGPEVIRHLTWLMFRLFAADWLRSRNRAGYALANLLRLVAEDEEALAVLDIDPIGQLFTGDADATEVIDRLSFLAGTTLILVEALVGAVDGVIDAAYGWDHEPDDDPESALVAARTLSVKFNIPGSSASPIISLVGVPAEHGGPGIVLSAGGLLEVTHDLHDYQIAFTLGAGGAFAVYLGEGGLRPLSGATPMVAWEVQPKPPPDGRPPSGEPALIIGADDGLRIEIGGMTTGIQIGADSAAFRFGLRDGKVVLALEDSGDGFLSNITTATLEIPFDVGVIADTEHGFRFEGGTGLRVNLPVAKSLAGVFTIQYLEVELTVGPDELELAIRGGFSVKLGAFQATIDALGVGLDFLALETGDLSKILPVLAPRGVGLLLNTGAVKGGGYLYIDVDRGEYAGALELTVIGVFSIKAICIITTKRPDGSDGWSLLMMVYGQFSVHIAFGIFLSGVGGMIGLHHKVDLDALTTGMKTGALDDILFPENPVGEAPRVIARYRRLFPYEQDTLLLGPVLELSFSSPPIVYVQLGLVFEVRDALGSGSASMTKVVLLGRLLAQLPPKATGAPAIVRILIDVVGFYDAEESFLLIRARLRDSFIGIEGLTKLTISGELLIAMRFGDSPSFVFTAGGFHPAFTDVPVGIPAKLDRLGVSFKVGLISLKIDAYFAITSNSVQFGVKCTLKAKLGPASIEGFLSFDALITLEPKFRFIVSLEFSVSLKAFGRTLASVRVRADLEGPGEWRIKGHFSFSILWWDVKVEFEESWGRGPEVGSTSVSARQALTAELTAPKALMPEGPIDDSFLVTLASLRPDDTALAHPLGRLTVRQRTVPMDVRIDRIGTDIISEGPSTFSITAVTVGDQPTDATETVLDHFARGQYMELSDAERIEGRSFERFTSGVTVGTTRYVVADDGGRVVKVEYEEKILEPRPDIGRSPWTLTKLRHGVHGLDAELLDVHVRMGAAAKSGRAHSLDLLAAGPGRAAVVQDAPLVLADPRTLDVVGAVLGPLAGSDAVARAQAVPAGAVVVEAFELENV